MKIPVNVKLCRTHHYACACRQWQADVARLTLKRVHEAACLEGASIETAQELLAEIRRMCTEALTELE